MYQVFDRQFQHEHQACAYAESIVKSKLYPCEVVVYQDGQQICTITPTGSAQILYRITTSGEELAPGVTVQEADAEVSRLQGVKKDDNIAALKAARDAYIAGYLDVDEQLWAAIGKIQSLPKSTSVITWIKTVKALFKTRKPLVTHEMPPEYLDFSSCGACPYGGNAIQNEVLGA